MKKEERSSAGREGERERERGVRGERPPLGAKERSGKRRDKRGTGGGEKNGKQRG